MAKSTKTALRRDLKKHPEGYHRARAELRLEAAVYRKAYKAEGERARRVRESATKIVRKAPEALPWNVAIIDDVDGSLYCNLNDGPTPRRSLWPRPRYRPAFFR